MIKRYNNLSFVFGVPGLILHVIGNCILLHSFNSTPLWDDWLGVSHPGAQLESRIGALVLLGGTGLMLVGFAYYAMAKGRSPAWCLLAFLSCIGLIILAFLPEESGAHTAPRSEKTPIGR
jgi:hypothetical protein